MRRALARWSAGLAGLLLGLSVGCKGNTGAASGPDKQTVQAAQKLPNGTNVLAALSQKDYDSVISGLAEIKQGISDDEQRTQFAILKRYVADVIQEAALKDEKAAEALNGLRILTQGR